MSNYYSILGVEKTATQDEIKKSYRKLASQHHPDKGGDTAKFQEIQTAYATLSDESKRAAYDNPNPFGNRPSGQNNGQTFDFESIFDIFGAQFRQQHNQQHNQQRPQARMTLWITLRDVATGGNRIVSMGTQSGTQEVSIDLPAGLEDGSNVRYAGLGPSGSDLIINFRVRPESNWQRQGTNLITDTTLSMWILVVGGTFPILDIRGNKLELTVPPHTQPGTMLRARNRGLPNQAGQVGDMLIKLHARIPPQISPELMAAIVKEIAE